MITLEQVRALEARVEKAVALIASLRDENASLRNGLAAADRRVTELEGLVLEFQRDQERIEQGIVEALRKLDAFEDTVHAAGAPTQAPAAPPEGRPAERAAEPVGLPAEAADGDGDEDADDAFPESEDQAAAGTPESDGLDIF